MVGSKIKYKWCWYPEYGESDTTVDKVRFPFHFLSSFGALPLRLCLYAQIPSSLLPLYFYTQYKVRRSLFWHPTKGWRLLDDVVKETGGKVEGTCDLIAPGKPYPYMPPNLKLKTAPSPAKPQEDKPKVLPALSLSLSSSLNR